MKQLSFMKMRFQASNLEHGCKFYKKESSVRLSISLKDHIYRPKSQILCSLLNLYYAKYFAHTVHSHCDTWTFAASILNYKPCNIPLKYRCPFKKCDHRRPTLLAPVQGICSLMAGGVLWW